MYLSNFNASVIMRLILVCAAAFFKLSTKLYLLTTPGPRARRYNRFSRADHLHQLRKMDAGGYTLLLYRL